jgi:hypothetical protein
MIEEKYLKKLEEIIGKEIQKGSSGEYCHDNESLHVYCDAVLLDFIKELGYKKIAEKYEEAEEYFWYA